MRRASDSRSASESARAGAAAKVATMVPATRN